MSDYQIPMRVINQRNAGVRIAKAAPPIIRYKVLSSIRGLLSPSKIIFMPRLRKVSHG